MFIVAGLGNPGARYARTRHNVGFMLLDRLAERWGACSFGDKFRASTARVDFDGQAILLLKPQTFMNLSGESIQAAASFYKVAVDRIVVVHDEMDLPLGVCRLKSGGGSAGHNGLRSVTQHMSSGFLRLRIGVGRPQGVPGDRWVLGNFTREEEQILPEILEKAAKGVEGLLREGPEKTMAWLHS